MCIKTAQREHLIRWQAAAVWFLKTHRPISTLCTDFGKMLKSHMTHTRILNQLLRKWRIQAQCTVHTSRSPLKGSDTIQPRIWALQHLTQPGTQEFLQGLWIISMPKNLWSILQHLTQPASGTQEFLQGLWQYPRPKISDHRGHPERGRGKGRAEHRTQSTGSSPGLTAAPFTLQLPKAGEQQLLRALELQEEPRPPLPKCPTPGCLSFWLDRGSYPELSRHLNTWSSCHALNSSVGLQVLFFLLNITWLKS